MSEAAAGWVDREAPVERIELDATSWVDLVAGFVPEAEAVYGALVESVDWRVGRLWRYERWIEEPRAGQAFRPGHYPHAALTEAHRVIQQRYRVQFDGLALARYRNGRDGQAFHRDDDLRYCEDTIVAIVSFGARRPWLLRPRTRSDTWIADRGGATHDLAPSGGDLLVMGGRCQLDWQHSVPQVRDRSDTGRISAQWRWTSRRGRPEVGAPYRAARNFSRTASGP